MIKGLIFDYGGTLDTAGRHWGKVLWQTYLRHNVPVTEQQFREAYVHAERTLGSQNIIKPCDTFYNTLGTKLAIELGYMKAEGHIGYNDKAIEELRTSMLDDVYTMVKNETAHSGHILSVLCKDYPMVLVSNFYGNINTVLKEFGLDCFFNHVIESAVVGIRKPDHRIFALGVKELGIKPEETIVVGDSFDKDIVPAKKAGCRTVWLKGEGWTEKNYDEKLPDAIITNLDELLDIESYKQFN